MKRFFVYILATRKDGPLYVGVTSALQKRVFEHRSHDVPGFSARYNVDKLVWYEPHDDAESAIVREKRIKRWRRDWKVALVEGGNPEWLDLFDTLGPE
ncbi:GIY-YIG nuclease family protein [Starkeya sp. ORNL1]|uniref:GIY-YIG nuclease family protein n=1 Tax=Starkeya sp. ORNL1 TaxID=2709380 RepID=UPI0014646DC2|nr:GIY-YIG nuclease family protein [Starkeya sp. ORNL1]QJP13979.1 GIY-YIG nuclease family protein [Starkeya sp. ORNL1]